MTDESDNNDTPITDEPGINDTPTTDEPGTNDTSTTDQLGNNDTPTVDEPCTNDTRMVDESGTNDTPTTDEPGINDTPTTYEPGTGFSKHYGQMIHLLLMLPKNNFCKHDNGHHPHKMSTTYGHFYFLLTGVFSSFRYVIVTWLINGRCVIRT
jgi:hypothetical protein